jgi:hypothetical protein
MNYITALIIEDYLLDALKYLCINTGRGQKHALVHRALFYYFPYPVGSSWVSQLGFRKL